MIIYLVKSTLLLGLLFGVYKLLLENEKMHRFNRFFLLFALVFGLTAPLISFEVSAEQSVAGLKMQQVERVVNAPAEAVSKSVEPLIAPEPAAIPKATTELTPVTANERGWSISILDVLLGMYGMVTFFLVTRFGIGLIEIRNKVKAGNHQKTKHATLVLLEEPITPQSFLGYIFLEKKQFESGQIEPEILHHEITHIRQRHSLDVLFIEFLKVIFWFNPLMYLYKHAIQLNHEFLADESVVSNASSVSDYQNMLIRVCAGNKPMNTTSSINYSLTKKRLKMMGKKFSTLRSGTKGLLLIPFLLASTFMFCTQSKQSDLSRITNNNEKYYSDVNLYLSHEKTEELKIKSPGFSIRYDSAGNPFSGNHITRYQENDQLAFESLYEDGLLLESISYDKNGDTLSRSEFGYIGDRYRSTKFYNENGILTHEFTQPSEDSLGYQKQWHPNGQLKYEAYYKGNLQYEGLMTLYDKEGLILEQERYKDGELVEKIK